MESLPSILNYDQVHPYVSADSVAYNSSAVPINGSTFGDSKIIEVILPKQNAFLIPDSLYISYQLTIAGTAPAITHISGVPAYAPFLRLDTQVGGKNIDSIQQYNLVQNLVVNTTFTESEKKGLGNGLYGCVASSVANNIEYLAATAATTYNFSAPLNCMLSNCTKALPLFAMGQIKLMFQLDTLTNFIAFESTNGVPAAIANTAAAIPTGGTFTISNFQVNYELFNSGMEYISHILNRPRLNIKTKSFIYISQPIAANTAAGQQTLNYNVNLNSIKAAFLYMSSSSKNATTPNGLFDSVDASCGGDYQLYIAGTPVPQKPISMSQSLAQAITELRKATTTLIPFQSIFDKANNMSLDNTQYAYQFNATTCNTSTIADPAKCFVGFHTEKLYCNELIFSGVSSQNSAIQIRINNSKGLHANLASGIQCGLILVFDALMEIDNEFQQINVQQ